MTITSSSSFIIQVNDGKFDTQDQSAISAFRFGQELLHHNLVVFRAGDSSLQVLPPLVDVIPEARLNLVIYYLKQVLYIKIYLFMLIWNAEFIFRFRLYLIIGCRMIIKKLMNLWEI